MKQVSITPKTMLMATALAQSDFIPSKVGHRIGRLILVAAWCDRQVLAPMTFQGHRD